MLTQHFSMTKKFVIPVLDDKQFKMNENDDVARE